MRCKSYGSENLREFAAEIAIHFQGLKNIEMTLWSDGSSLGKLIYVKMALRITVFYGVTRQGDANRIG